MNHPSAFLLTLAFMATTLVGQQVGDANRNYTINGVGSNQASFVQSSIGVPGTMQNTYSTLDPNAPVLWAIAPTSTIGWLVTATNSVDIGPAGLFFMLDGAFITSTNPLNNFARTDALGNFPISIVAPATLANQTHYFAMAHVAATSPDNLWVSQTHQTLFQTDPNLNPSNATCNPGGTPLALTDDSFIQQPLGFAFPFYGTAYTECFVGSNGYVTFVSGSTLLGESVATFLSGQPSIRMFWDDLNPAAAGSVTFFTDNLANFEVCFNAVPQFATNDANSFKLSAASGTAISIDYGAMGALDGLVGLSPGGSLAVGLPLNLSVGPNAIAAGTAPYELFTPVLPVNPNDLPGLRVNFLTDATGTPTQQF